MLAEDRRLMCQRQRTLLFKAWQAVWASFMLVRCAPQSSQASAEVGLGACYTYSRLALQWRRLSLRSTIFYKIVSKSVQSLPCREVLSISYWATTNLLFAPEGGTVFVFRVVWYTDIFEKTNSPKQNLSVDLTQDMQETHRELPPNSPS